MTAKTLMGDTTILLATAVTTVLTCLALAFVDLTTTFSIYSFSFWLVIPVGALFSGVIAYSGFYIAARELNIKPSGLAVAGVLLLSLATFFVINYLDYYFTVIDGISIHRYLSFGTYLGISLNHMSMCIHGCAGGGINLGVLGFVAAGLQIAGFAVAGFVMLGLLSAVPYCLSCSRYFVHKDKSRRYARSTEHADYEHAAVMELLRGGQYQAALARHPAFGEEAMEAGCVVASDLNVHHCVICGRHHIRLGLQYRKEKDWKDVPKTEGNFETPPNFSPTGATGSYVTQPF